MKNPWAERWRGFKDGHDKGEDAMLEQEARWAEQTPTVPCNKDGCDGTGYYRPGVGGWWCNKCRDLVKV